jgi:hypothetical protein
LTEKKKDHKILIYNVLFLVVGGAILAFLLNAPKETTHRMPRDDNHRRFYEMDKKAAEKFCLDCHTAEGQAGPLPKDHPSKFRCLLCHKKVS